LRNTQWKSLTRPAQDKFVNDTHREDNRAGRRRDSAAEAELDTAIATADKLQSRFGLSAGI
jgi:hypothetical protein